jgi:hypothetical protein
MKIASVSELKKEFKHLENEELIELLSSLMKYSKENKELLNYLLFEADYEENYISKIKEEISIAFQNIDSRSWKTMKKPIQRILKLVKKYIKYSKKPETEIELLIYFCEQMLKIKLSFKRNPIVFNIYMRQITTIDKVMLSLHEDLRADFNEQIEKLKEL